MTLLNETVLATLETTPGVYNIATDYTLNGGTLSIPYGKTLLFNSGGTINNGTLEFDHNILTRLDDGSINAIITGTIQNTVLYTKHITSINNLKLGDYAGKTIYCNQNESNVNNIIELKNTNSTQTTIFDGMNNTFTCSSDFFEIRGQSNIIIKNFNAISTDSTKEFENMVTTDANVTGVQILNNTIMGFKVGISLNNDSATYTVSYCTVSGNYVSNCPGHDAGQGYGIHLANARYCTISGNEVVNCERHAIYHAYGENNIISGNIIREHCQSLTDYRLLAALEIGRKSKNVTVQNNTFVSCNNVCLLIYSPLPSNDGDEGIAKPWRYGRCENIDVKNNSFYRGTLTGSIANYPFVYIGVGETSYSDLSSEGTVVVDVKIRNNTFQKSGGENQKCIQIQQCEELEISGNTFQLGLPSSPQSSEYLVIDIPYAPNGPNPYDYITGYHTAMTIIRNTFTYLTNGVGNLYLIGMDMSKIDTSVNSNYTIAWTSNTLQNQIIGGITRYQLSKYTPGNNFTIS